MLCREIENGRRSPKSSREKFCRSLKIPSAKVINPICHPAQLSAEVKKKSRPIGRLSEIQTRFFKRDFREAIHSRMLCPKFRLPIAPMISVERPAPNALCAVMSSECGYVLSPSRHLSAGVRACAGRVARHRKPQRIFQNFSCVKKL
jgi:hypothetical protein